MFSKKPIDLIKNFADTNYPNLELNLTMLDQLVWLETNSVNTSQSNVQTKPDTVNIEVKRVLSRLHCLKLFEQGNHNSFELFTQAQTKQILSEETFNRLANFIKNLSDNARQSLVATCFITKSDQAIEAIPFDERTKVPTDSEQFISYVVANYPTIFPICKLLNEDSLKLLPFAFFKNAHARHILDMEGGANMLFSLSEAIQTETISYEQYNLWFARWIINIAGLDGHLNSKGSLYLTEPVAECILALKSELDKLCSNPHHPVLENYLAFKTKQLKVNNHYVAYLGTLMRQHSPEIASEIQAWFSNLPEAEQIERQKEFKRVLEHTKVTPTYRPTVLLNLLSLGCSISEALTIFVQIESKAMQAYLFAIEKALISDLTPLSFRNIAFKESLAPLKDYYQNYAKLPEFEIDSSGNLKIRTEILLENSVTDMKLV